MANEKKAVKEQQDKRQAEDLTRGVICDFSRVNMRWGMNWLDMDDEFELLEMIRDQGEDAPMEERRNAIKKTQQLQIDRIALIAQVLAGLDSDWLVDGTPDGVDFSNPENILDYVRESKHRQLQLAVHILRVQDSGN